MFPCTVEKDRFCDFDRKMFNGKINNAFVSVSLSFELITKTTFQLTVQEKRSSTSCVFINIMLLPPA